MIIISRHLPLPARGALRRIVDAAGLVRRPIRRCIDWVGRLGCAPVFFCLHLSRAPEGAIVFFPIAPAMLCCGFAGIVALKEKRPPAGPIDAAGLSKLIDRIDARRCQDCLAETSAVDAEYLGGAETLAELDRAVGRMKTDASLLEIFSQGGLQNELVETGRRLAEIAAREEDEALRQIGRFDSESFRVVLSRIEKFKDIGWRLSSEVLQNVEKIRALYASAGKAPWTAPCNQLPLPAVAIWDSLRKCKPSHL